MQIAFAKLLAFWFLLTRKGKSLNFCHYVMPIKPVSHAIRSFFICEKFPLLLYLLAFSLQVCLSLRSMCKVSQKCRRKCHSSIRERELSQKPNLCLLGAWQFPQRNRCTEKCWELLAQKFNGPRLGSYPGGGGYSFALAIWECTSVCSPKEYGFSIEPLLQNNHKIFSFL